MKLVFRRSILVRRRLPGGTLSARRIRVPKLFLSTALLVGVTLVSGVLAAAPGLAASIPMAATSTGSSSPTTSGVVTPPPGSTCTVHYDDNRYWPGGRQVNVTIDNLTTVTKYSWTLTWDFNDDQQITQMWSSTYQQAGRHLTVRSPSFGGLPAMGSVNLGFISRSPGGATVLPGNVMLDGQICTLVQVLPPPPQ